MFGKSDGDIEQLKREFAEDLIMKDLGAQTSFLCIEILLHKKAVCLRQKKMIDQLLENFQMKLLKPVKASMGNDYGSHPYGDGTHLTNNEK